MEIWYRFHLAGVGIVGRKMKVRSVELAVHECERSKFDEPHQAETAIDHLSLIILIVVNMCIDTVIDVM